MNAFKDLKNVTGIIFANLPGEQTGPAIVDVLFGDVNPSGRLPFTIGKVTPNKSDYWAINNTLYRRKAISPRPL